MCFVKLIFDLLASCVVKKALLGPGYVEKKHSCFTETMNPWQGRNSVTIQKKHDAIILHMKTSHRWWKAAFSFAQQV